MEDRPLECWFLGVIFICFIAYYIYRIADFFGFFKDRPEDDFWDRRDNQSE